MSRRGHSYFNGVNRRSEAGKAEPRQPNSRTPLAKPKDEPGVLWDAFREDKSPA